MKKVLIIICCMVLLFVLSSCTQSERVSHNLRQEADEFNVRRRLTVLNTRTDTPMMQITGLISISVDADKDLNIVAEIEPGKFILNYAHLSDDTTYLVEQVETKEVDKYRYEIVLYPQNLIYGLFDYKISD